jgi:hypothetical protein
VQHFAVVGLHQGVERGTVHAKPGALGLRDHPLQTDVRQAHLAPTAAHVPVRAAEPGLFGAAAV